MPTPKRERKRENKNLSRAAQLEAARQAKKRKTAIRTAILAAVVAGLVVFFALVNSGGNGEDVTAGSKDSPTTTSAEATSTTVNAALAAITCDDRKSEEKTDRPTYDKPPEMTIDAAKAYTATLDTSCGKIVVALDAEAAPKTVNNFVTLARDDFYDGLTWHRVVKDFVIQGGDPDGNGTGGPGYEFEDELPADGYKLGSLAMANSGPNTNGSQFFVVTGEKGTTLESNYSRFGMVTEGLEVAQKLESFAQDDQKPSRPLYIFDVEIGEAPPEG